MSPALSGALPAAVELWRRNPALLNAVAGVFFLLPVLASQLFLPLPELPVSGTAEPGSSEATAALAAWLAANAHWLVLNLLVQAFGGAVVLTLVLDPARPTLSTALGRAAQRFPVYALAWLVALCGVAAGSLVFVVPGLYVLGRTFLTGAVVIAEPRQSIGGAMARGLALTRSNGWMLLLLTMGISGGAYLAGALGADAEQALGIAAGSVSVAAGLISVAISLASAVSALLIVLLQAVLYTRLVAVPRQGI